MPLIVDNYTIPTHLKKTTKYTDDDKDHVRYLHSQGKSTRTIEKETGISRRMVQFILYPERLEHAKKLFKERQKDGRYRYSTEKQTALVRSVPERKKELLKDNQLIKKTK